MTDIQILQMDSLQATVQERTISWACQTEDS